MLWSDFSRMCQAAELASGSNEKVAILQGANLTEEGKQILKLEYEVNFIAEKSATLWLAKAFQLLPDDVRFQKDVHGDLAEGMRWIIGVSKPSEYTVKQVKQLLELNCNAISSDTYDLISGVLLEMSELELKWFIRYWVRKPRNGINSGLVEKAFGKPKDVFRCGVALKPQLAKTMKGIPKTWPLIMDFKYDGIRVQIHRAAHTIILFNRKCKDITNKYPDVVETIRSWGINDTSTLYQDYILDGEIYPVEHGRPAPFQKMGTRIHSKDIAKAVEMCSVKLCVFDFICENKPLRERLKIMETIVPEEYRAVRYGNFSDYASFEQHKNLFYAQAIEAGYEGIMLKDANGIYEPSKRKWLKHKPPRIDLDVVVTSARYGEGKRNSVYGSYDISVRDEGGFVSVGSLGTGFSDEELNLLTAALRKIVLRFEGDTYHFSPRMVLSVTADLVSQDKKGNWGLRFPRMVSIRDDKPVSEINTIEDVMGYAT